MKLDRQSLRRILIQEACGCMDPGLESDYVMGYKDTEYEVPDAILPGSIDKDSVLNSVAVLAMASDCPATREALLSVVYDLM